MRDPASAAGTNWWTLPVDQMWSMIERHDSRTLQPLINGWRRSYELVLEHLSSVKRYREGLAAAWPPDRSPAARAYLDRLDVLVRSLEETYEAAAANHRAFTLASGALNSTRSTMNEIQREHAANQAALAAYRDDMRMYHLVGGKAKGVPPQSPVPEARQLELEQQARRAMSALSTELAQAQVSLITPTPYLVPVRTEEGATSSLKLADPSQIRASSTTLGSSQSLRSLDDAKAGVALTSQFREPGYSSISNNILPSARKPAHESMVGGIAERDRLSSKPPSGSRARISPRGAVPPVLRPDLPAPPPPPAAYRPSANLPPASSSTQLNPSGVIGGTPPIPQRAALSARNIERVNPIGGVIGSVPPQSTEPHSTPRRRTAAPNLDPDDPWKVTQGISPVITPSPERPIDPGPVLGMNRP